MRKLLLVSITLITLQLGAQSTKDILIGSGFDLVKTDIAKVFDKAQIGFEGHFFIVRHFAAGAGVEYWTTGQKSSFMLGVRYYATEKLFLRFRGLIGANELALGVGWSHPLNASFRAEAMGDFYMINTDFALRAGIAYIIKLKH